MKNISFTYRFFAAAMAILMLIASAGFTLDMHFCQGKLKSVNVLGKAKNCHELATAMPAKCPHHKAMAAENTGCSKAENDCCNNKTLRFQLDQDQTKPAFDFEINQPLLQFITAFVTVFFTNNFGEKDIPSFKNYKPPLIPKDVAVLFQTFLL